MANLGIVQFAVLASLAAVFMCALIVYSIRKSHRELSRNVPQPAPAKPAESKTMLELERPAPPTIAVEPVMAATPKPEVVVQVQPSIIPENHNQRILSGISENIRKSAIKPVAKYSPIQYPETPRDTEYVRIKKKIITPHGKVRFSILKDSIATNMLAIFRRACMDWKSPNDLISFLPSYLEPEAEILNNQLLLVGTPGHHEKLAIPMRSIGSDSIFRDCFDFVTDDRTATNTPAVVIASDDEFEIVSRGVIAQPVFLSSVERSPVEVMLLVEKSPLPAPSTSSILH